jgi:thioesterase domain-containing protein
MLAATENDMSDTMTLTSSPASSPASAAPASPLGRMQQLASKVAWTESLGRAKSVIVPLNESATGLPFYCVHSLSGKATDYIALARMLGPDQPLYGIQMPMKNRNADFGGEIDTISVPAIADHYREALERFQPAGPLALGGWSVGSLIAYEMARQLRARGRDVRLLVAFDMAPWNSGADTSPRHLPYLGALLRNALPWAANHRLFRQPSLQSIRAIVAQKAAATAAAIAVRPGEERYRAQDFIDTSKYPPAHVALMQDILDVMLRYQPGHYDGRVQVYVAKNEIGFSHFPKMTAQWLKVAPGARIMAVSGSHQTMIEEKNGARLARDLGHLLARLVEPA